MQTTFCCLVLVTSAMTIKLNSILFYSVMVTENKLYAKSAERKRYKIPWQNLYANITGEMEKALTPVESFATSFIYVHHAGNLN